MKKEYNRIRIIIKEIDKHYPDATIRIYEVEQGKEYNAVTVVGCNNDTINISFNTNTIRDKLLSIDNSDAVYSVDLDEFVKAIYDYDCRVHIDSYKSNTRLSMLERHINCIIGEEYFYGLERYFTLSAGHFIVTANNYQYDSDDDYVEFDAITCNYIRKIQKPSEYHHTRFGLFKIAAALDYEISISPSNSVYVTEHDINEDESIFPIGMIVESTSSNLYNIKVCKSMAKALSIIDGIVIKTHDSYLSATVYLYDIAKIIANFELYANINPLITENDDGSLSINVKED